MANSSGTFPEAATHYTSFDGSTQINSQMQRPDRYRYWDELAGSETRLIPRGGGYSYAAASFGSSVLTIEHCRFNRILGFDEAAQTLEVEAGITLGEVYDFLTPRGLFLAVQPGHPSITVGGCAAADVHGKNQFLDGTFVNQVRKLKLFHPSHGIIELSREQEPELFFLTCGGYGLTGNILSLTLATKSVRSLWIKMKTQSLTNARNLGDALREAARTSELVYTWHDFTATGEAFGRGFVKSGTFVDRDNSEARKNAAFLTRKTKTPITSETRGSWRTPFFNSLSTRLFNHVYYRANRIISAEGYLPIFDFIFPVHDKESYFKLFGKAGFHEYQAIVPFERYDTFVAAVQERLQQTPIGITLASAKLFKGQSELLRFTGDGICFALNFPRTRKSFAFAGFLDELVIRIGGRPNLIKDSRLSAEVVAKTYGPGYSEFRSRLQKFDPKRLYRSELSERLGL